MGMKKERYYGFSDLIRKTGWSRNTVKARMHYPRRSKYGVEMKDNHWKVSESNFKKYWKVKGKGRRVMKACERCKSQENLKQLREGIYIRTFCDSCLKVYRRKIDKLISE